MKKEEFAHDENGNLYRFKYKAFWERYAKLDRKRPTQTGVVESKGLVKDRIKAETHKGKETVRDWIYGKHSPKEVQDIIIIENVMNVPHGTFYEPVETQKIEVKTNMREISECERNTAREFYREMVSNIWWVKEKPEYEDPVLVQFIEGTTKSGGTDSKEWGLPWHTWEKTKLLKRIEAARFDLPKKLCDTLKEMADAIYGEWEDETIQPMFFNTQAYRDYLEKNGLEDNVESKYLYADVLDADLRAKLEDAFREYFPDREEVTE